MNQDAFSHIIEEIDVLITETRQLMESFESTGMDEKMPDDYDKLEMLVTQALKDQRFYTQAMLKAPADVGTSS